MQLPWRLSFLPPPSLLCLEALALCLRGLEEVDICFLYQSFVLWAPTLCRTEIPAEGQLNLSRFPHPAEKLGCGQRESGGRRCEGRQVQLQLGPPELRCTVSSRGVRRIDLSPHVLLIALSALPFLPGVQAREKQPAEPPAPLRKRAASDGQYENQSPEPTSPRSPGVRSPVQCVSPELALTIALNPGGRPKEVSSGATEGSRAHLNY